MSVTKDEVSDLIKANNEELMASFKELLKDTEGQIKRATKLRQNSKWKRSRN